MNEARLKAIEAKIAKEMAGKGYVSDLDLPTTDAVEACAALREAVGLLEENEWQGMSGGYDPEPACPDCGEIPPGKYNPKGSHSPKCKLGSFLARWKEQG